MALQTIPGLTGLTYARVSSMDGRAIGKFTDSNHLESFHKDAPQDYDKKIISIYTQTGLVANDFLAMINKSTPFELDGLSDTWKWDIEKPFSFPKIVDVPATTTSQSDIGIDGKLFEIVVDTYVAKGSVISVGHRIFGPQLFVAYDPQPVGSRAHLLTCQLRTANPLTDTVDPKYLQQGMDFKVIDHPLGEFDQDLAGLPKLADKISMFESLGAGYGFEHKITAWADDKMLKDSKGRPLDIMVYMDRVRNGEAITKNSIKWEPFIEFQLRKAMMEMKVDRMIWNKPGITRTNGSKQELKKTSAGVYYRMRNSGNYVPYNRGELSSNLFRSVFGDLFYRRVDVSQRRVKMYTNEAGIDAWEQMIKTDAFDSGLTFNVGDNDKFIQGSGQNLVYNFAFNAMVTRETGRMEVVHLKELDLPQTNLEFGQNKKSTPVFLVFDVSPTGDGTLANNIREVRRAGTPNMQWGYIDGRRHHLGAMASQGHSAASKFPGYEIFMEDRSDVFIEDMSRTVLIEEIPQF